MRTAAALFFVFFCAMLAATVLAAWLHSEHINWPVTTAGAAVLGGFVVLASGVLPSQRSN